MNHAAKQSLHHADVVRIVGRIDDSQIAAILGTGASVEQLVEAMTWVEKKGEMGAEVRHPMDPKVSQLYGILESAKPDWETGER
jgi:hypothetical protein